MGGAVEQLEKELAQRLAAGGAGEAAAVATGFGRAALALALETVGVEQGDVLVPDFVCAQVPAAVRWGNGRPVPYRVSRELRIDPEDFSAALTPETRAAIVVHYFGRVQPHIEKLAAICQERGVTLIEDCALALGARRGPRLAGTFGGVAVFSFTKSNWCYGGGAAVFWSAQWAGWARNLRTRRSRAGRRVAFFYGLLRRADWACNRPSRVRLAEAAGRSVEALARNLIPAFRVANFFDAGALDTRMTSFAARRALRVLRGIPAALQAQKAVHQRIVEAVRGCSSGLAPIAALPGDTGVFLLLWAEKGSAADLRERAARAGVTLRLSWPAYQPPWAGASGAVPALGERLLILEVHPRSTARDATAICNALASL